jgi:hypothetical protein
MFNATYHITNVERRTYSRVPVKYLAVVIGGNEFYYATVQNISEKGLGIRTPHCFELGEIIKIKLNCHYSFGDNILDQFTIMINAQVMWVRVEIENVYLAGLRILDACHEDLHKLKNHIQILYLQAAINQ